MGWWLRSAGYLLYAIRLVCAGTERCDDVDDSRHSRRVYLHYRYTCSTAANTTALCVYTTQTPMQTNNFDCETCFWTLCFLNKKTTNEDYSHCDVIH